MRRGAAAALALTTTMAMSGVAGAAAGPSLLRSIAAIGNGYVLVDGVGHVTAVGTAYHGSTPSFSPETRVVGIAADAATGGYWVATDAGNVFNLDAPFYGSMAHKSLPAPVIGITATSTGYLLTTTDGNVYNFDTPFHGSEAGKNEDNIAIAVDPETDGGYWLLSPEGPVTSYDTPVYPERV